MPRTLELFKELLRRQGVSSKAVSHCGNDYKSDVMAARRVGLTPQPFLEGNLNRFEKILASYSLATEGLSSVMAGASRLARLKISASFAEEEALRDVAAGVAAPILVGFRHGGQ